jgi:hypothetical protein
MKQFIRHRLRRGNRNWVQNPTFTNGAGVALAHNLYSGELYYDTTDGHVWVSNGTYQTKIDPRAIVTYNGEIVVYNGEVILY